MLLAVAIVGVEVDSADLVWLADVLVNNGFLETASKLLHADSGGRRVTPLTIEDCDGLLQVLDDAPQRLDQLRAALLRHYPE